MRLRQAAAALSKTDRAIFFLRLQTVKPSNPSPVARSDNVPGIGVVAIVGSETLIVPSTTWPGPSVMMYSAVTE